jgi:WD40 repeat protein
MPSPARDRVFISYSHRDKAWLDWVLIFLKPLLPEDSLSIWSDLDIEVGGRWEAEIEASLERAAVALLLVSQPFLASDFIRKKELPVLLDAADRGLLKLVWVPISACHWNRSPLKDYQAACDADQPLQSLSEHDRNTALVQITSKVADFAEAFVGSVSTVSTVARNSERATPAIEPRRPMVVPGDLHNVPDLPPHFVPRADDLGRLRRSLLEHNSGAVGIIGEPYRMGLHGQGGIGKSVLAAALARDEQVRLAFPGGVFWVTVGQTPDVPRLQAALLAEAGADSTAVTDEQKGRALLQERFAGRAVLLVLDDVWDHRHARAFDVLGPDSRLLVTTRDGAVLTALGAHPETVQRLPEAAALALLSNWAGHGGDALPEVAREVARECGHLPLALSLAGARVQDGTTWDVLLKALKQGRLEFLDHPYGSVFGSMRLSVDALPTHDRERYFELAVFPEDERVPVPVVLALWRETAGLDELAGEALLSRLRSKALLEMFDTDGRREVTLHDLQHDFLRLSVRDLSALHGRLLAALAAGLPTADKGAPWWLLPADATYAWSHMAWHLVAAGRDEELRDLLFDCRWLEAKLRATGLPAVLADFAALPRDGDLSLLAGALRLSGHVIGGDPGQLRSQLTGRLLGMERPRIAGMLRGAATIPGGPWLRPTMPSLTPPTGPLLRTLSGHAGWIRTVAITADSRRAVSGSDDGTIKVWDLEMGVEECTLAGHARAVTTVAVTADGRWAVSGSFDGTVKVWNLEVGAEERTLTGHAAGVMAVAVTADGRRAVSSSFDKTVKVWDLEMGMEEHTLEGHTDWVWAVALTPDGRRAVSGSSDGTVKVWELETGVEEHTLEGHLGAVMAVVVTADGRWAVFGSSDRTVRMWNLKTGAERTLAGHTDWVRAVAVTADGRHAVSGSDDQTLKVWELTAGTEERALAGHAGGIRSVAMTADGRRAASGSTDRTVKVWELETGDERTLEGHTDWVKSVAVTADGRRAVSGSYDGTLKVWNLETSARERTLEGHTNAVIAVAMRADGRYAISGSSDGTMKVWDLETGAEKHTLEGHSDWVRTVAATADGRVGLSGSDDWTVKVWDLETGAEKRTLKGHAGPVMAVATTADGRRIVSGSYDGTVKVWDLETGSEECTLTGHGGPITAVAVMANGRRAVSCSADRTLKVWDLALHRNLAAFTADAPIDCCAATPDGVRLIAGDSLGRVHFLSLEGLLPA